MVLYAVCILSYSKPETIILSFKSLSVTFPRFTMILQALHNLMFTRLSILYLNSHIFFMIFQGKLHRLLWTTPPSLSPTHYMCVYMCTCMHVCILHIHVLLLVHSNTVVLKYTWKKSLRHSHPDIIVFSFTKTENISLFFFAHYPDTSTLTLQNKV